MIVFVDNLPTKIFVCKLHTQNIADKLPTTTFVDKLPTKYFIDNSSCNYPQLFSQIMMFVDFSQIIIYVSLSQIIFVGNLSTKHNFVDKVTYQLNTYEICFVDNNALPTKSEHYLRKIDVDNNLISCSDLQICTTQKTLSTL